MANNANIADMIKADTGIDISGLTNVVAVHDHDHSQMFEDFIKHLNVSHILWTVIEIIIVGALIYGALLFIDRLAKQITKFAQVHDYDVLFLRFMPLISKFVKLLVIIFFILVLGNIHGVNLSSVIAGIGIGGVAIGFAAKESIADVFGTIVLIADKSFKIGDYIEIDKSVSTGYFAGVVEDINFRSSKLRSTDGALSVIPNHILAASIIRNLSASNRKCIQEYIGITYDTPKDKVKEAIEICRSILKENPEINNNYTVELNSLSDSSLKIMVRAFTFSTDWADMQRIKNDMLLEIYDKFNTAKIEFAFNTQTLHIKK